MMKQARRSLSASPVTAPKSYIPARDVHVKALAEERQARRSMTPDDPVIAAQIAAEDRARMEKYRSGSIQMSERERQRRMPRSSVPTATDVPAYAPKVVQRTQPRDIRAMRSSVSLQPQAAPVAEVPQRQRQPPRKLSQMRSSVSAVPEAPAPAPAPAQPTRRGISEGTLARRYPAMEERKRKRALTPVPLMDKSLGNHQVAPMKPVVKRPRPGPSLPQPDLKALKRMGPPMSRSMTEEQRQKQEARELSRSRMPSASLDPMEKQIGTKEDRPSYVRREQQEAAQQTAMSLRKKPRVSFSPQVQEKEFDPTGLKQAVQLKQMKPDRGFRRDVPSRKKKEQIAKDLLVQEEAKTKALLEQLKRGKSPPTLHATETSKAYGPEEELFDPDADAAPAVALQKAQSQIADLEARRARGRTPPALHEQQRAKAERVEQPMFDPDADAAPAVALQKAQSQIAVLEARRERGRTPPVLHEEQRTKAEPIAETFEQPQLVQKAKPSFVEPMPAAFQQPSLVRKAEKSFVEALPQPGPAAQPIQEAPLAMPEDVRKMGESPVATLPPKVRLRKPLEPAPDVQPEEESSTGEKRGEPEQAEEPEPEEAGTAPKLMSESGRFKDAAQVSMEAAGMMGAKDVLAKQTAQLQREKKSMAQQKHDITLQRGALGTMQQSMGVQMGEQQKRHEEAMGGLRTELSQAQQAAQAGKMEMGGLRTQLSQAQQAVQERKKLVHKKQKVPTMLTPAQALGGAPQGFPQPAQQDPRLAQANQMIQNLRGHMDIQQQRHGLQSAQLRAQRNSDHAQLNAFSAGQASQHQQYNTSLAELQKSLAEKKTQVSGLQAGREDYRQKELGEYKQQMAKLAARNVQVKKQAAETLETSRKETQAARLRLQQHVTQKPEKVSLVTQPTSLIAPSMGVMTQQNLPPAAPAPQQPKPLQRSTASKFYEHTTLKQEQLSGGAPVGFESKPQKVTAKPVQQQLKDTGISGGSIGQPKVDTPAPVRAQPTPVRVEPTQQRRTVAEETQETQVPVQQRRRTKTELTQFQKPFERTLTDRQPTFSLQKRMGGLGLEEDEKTEQRTVPFKFDLSKFEQKTRPDPVQSLETKFEPKTKQKTKPDPVKFKDFTWTQVRQQEEERFSSEVSDIRPGLRQKEEDLKRRQKELDVKRRRLQKYKFGFNPPSDPGPSGDPSSSGTDKRPVRKQRRRGRQDPRPGPGPGQGPGPGPGRRRWRRPGPGRRRRRRRRGRGVPAALRAGRHAVYDAGGRVRWSAV